MRVDQARRDQPTVEVLHVVDVDDPTKEAAPGAEGELCIAGPQVMLKATFTPGHSTKPATIDYVNLAGAAKGKSQSGIYELSGDTLRVCMSAPGGPRPSDFSSKPGDGRSYTVWQRM